MAVGAVVARILTQYSDKGSKAAQKDIAKMGKNFDAFAKKVTKAFAVAGAAVAAFAVKVGKDAVQAAIADQKSQALLANSLRNTTGATTSAIAAVEQYISKLQLQVGVADDELRPALSKLAAVTGDVAAAQDLLGTALDISAFSGSDLGTATTALTRALQGNFRGLQKLVPSLTATTLKSKNFAAIMAEVQKATQGAAASRANTLEYRLEIMRIRFGEVLETLGYALLPVIEDFANTLQKKVLPQVEKWIKANKKDLVEGLRAAAKMAVKLVEGAVAFSQWIMNNTGLIKAFIALMATMWATAKLYLFITGLQGIATAFGLITVGANGATAATLRFKKAAGFLLRFGKILVGVLAVLGLSGAAATGAGGFAKGTVGEQISIADAARRREAKRYMKFQKGRAAQAATAGASASAGAGSLDAVLAKLQGAQDKLNNSKKKELSIEDKIIKKMLQRYGLTLMTSKIEAQATAASIAANLNRQAEIAKAPTVSLAAQGDGSATNNPISGGSNPVITVNVSTPYVTPDDVVVDITNQQRVQYRRAGDYLWNGRPTGMFAR